MNHLENDHSGSEEEKLKREIREEKREVEELKDVIHREEEELHLKEEKLEELEKPRPITVYVNEQPVVFKEHVVTGEQIIVTAVDQGVKIEKDFNLFEKSHGVNKPVSPDEHVKLCEGQKFKAVAPDDNSMF